MLLSLSITLMYVLLSVRQRYVTSRHTPQPLVEVVPRAGDRLPATSGPQTRCGRTTLTPVDQRPRHQGQQCPSLYSREENPAREERRDKPGRDIRVPVGDTPTTATDDPLDLFEQGHLSA